ncbi:MAG: Asp-tRNA(Asn)/Glu-tRNA(Gln) amidotransferase subunit GatC [Acidimicrobiia bacterium]
MPIDIDIAHVARLARLDLGPEELDTYRDQLGVILEHAAKVQALDTDGVHPTAHPLQMTNTFRDDEVRPSLDRDEVLAAAPEARDGYFVVPPAMDQD